MKVYVNKITGLDDALVSLMMSKRSYTREKEVEIRRFVKELENNPDIPAGIITTKLESLHKWGVEHGHTTLLRYIDISITIEGFHRGAQDDLDAHVRRMDNRIVRASTRLANFEDGEVSDWYKGKIVFPIQAFKTMGIEVPKSFTDEHGINYVLTDYGYIREDLKKDPDVKRGLYTLSIPSNCIFKIQLPELAHIIQFRNKFDGHAHPELWDMCDQIVEQLNDSLYPGIGDWLYEITTDKPVSKEAMAKFNGTYIPGHDELM